MGIDATEALSPSPTIIGAGRPGSVIAGKSGLAGACVRGTILNAEMVPSAPKIKPIQSSMEQTRRAREPEPSQGGEQTPHQITMPLAAAMGGCSSCSDGDSSRVSVSFSSNSFAPPSS